MFDNDEYIDYDRIVEDSDDLELYDDEYDFEDNDYESNWENYYHNLAEDIE